MERHIADAQATRQRIQEQLSKGPLAISKADYARATGVSPQTVNRLIKARQIRTVQFGENARVMIPIYELERFLRPQPETDQPLLTRSAPLPLSDEA